MRLARAAPRTSTRTSGSVGRGMCRISVRHSGAHASAVASTALRSGSEAAPPEVAAFSTSALSVPVPSLSSRADADPAGHAAAGTTSPTMG